MSQRDDSRILRRWFAVIVVLVVVGIIGLILWPFILPLGWAAILTFLMLPLQKRLARRCKGSDTIAAGILTALTPIAIFTPLSLLALAFGKQLAGMGATLQQNNGLLDVQSWLDPSQHPHIASAATWLSVHFDVQLSSAQKYLHENAQQWTSRLAKFSGLIVLNTAGALLRFFLMLFVLFFMLRGGAGWFERVTALLPLAKTKREALFERLGKVLRAVVYGCGLTALAQGALVTIGFLICGLSGPIVFGVIASVAALLPFGGAALVWAPGVLYLFATGKIGLAIFLLAWGGVVSTADNFIRPAIISRYTPVPTLLVFLGVIGGVAAFGLIGFVIGPVMLMLAMELLRYAEGSVARVERVE